MASIQPLGRRSPGIMPYSKTPVANAPASPPPHSTSRNPRSRSRDPRSRISLYSITTDNGHPECIWKLGDQVIHRGLDQGPPALSDWSNRTLLRAHDNYNFSSMVVLLQSKVTPSIFIAKAREAGPEKIHIMYNQTFPWQRNTRWKRTSKHFCQEIICNSKNA